MVVTSIITMIYSTLILEHPNGYKVKCASYSPERRYRHFYYLTAIEIGLYEPKLHILKVMP